MDEVPRVARLLALAIVFEEMVRTGEVESYAEIARTAGVSRAYVSRVMRVLELAPEIQQHVLLPSWDGTDAGDANLYRATSI